VLLDPRKARVLKAGDLHESDYTPWEGRPVAVWPSMTLLRGKVVVEGGTFHGQATDGQFIKRKVLDEIRSGPVL
jgi:dihydropyrimidinase